VTKKPRCPSSIAKSSDKTPLFEQTMLESLGNPSDRSQYTNLFLGRAGEYFVASELLRRGLNPFLSPVDTGIDLVAHQEFIPPRPLLHAVHNVFLFQVKTTARDEYADSIPTRTVHDWWHKRVNLVIVFWSENTQPTCLILPPSLLHMLTSGGFDDPKAPLKIGTRKVTLRVFRRGTRLYMRNMHNDLTAMQNRFDRIESIDSDSQIMPSYAVWGDGSGLLQIEP
jgi:hypothetical protein